MCSILGMENVEAQTGNISTEGGKEVQSRQISRIAVVWMGIGCKMLQVNNPNILKCKVSSKNEVFGISLCPSF